MQYFRGMWLVAAAVIVVLAGAAGYGMWTGYIPNIPPISKVDDTKRVTDPEKVVDVKQQVLDLIVDYYQISRAVAAAGADEKALEAAKARQQALLTKIKSLVATLRPEDVTAGMKRFVDER